jgi:hypothetical protein
VAEEQSNPEIDLRPPPDCRLSLASFQNVIWPKPRIQFQESQRNPAHPEKKRLIKIPLYVAFIDRSLPYFEGFHSLHGDSFEDLN